MKAIDDAAASKTPAAVRTTASIRLRGAAACGIDRASDSPRESDSGVPSALAKAPTEATRRSGISSRPAATARSSSGETSGLIELRLVVPA